ncbi:MAG: hypothetical protein QM729_04690 [Solirubrobacterales bacterium]
MREKLNENQTAQIALVAVLALVVGYLVLGNMGGGSSSPESASGSTASTEGETATVAATTGSASAGAVESTPAAATSSVTAPADQPLPKAVDEAYENGETIALLVYRPGGIDDHKVTEAASVLDEIADVAYFSTPVDKVARYSAITGPLGVSGAPALIVVQPRDLSEGSSPTATVDYGFQSAADIRQDVVDARYKGPELTYAPE